MADLTKVDVGSMGGMKSLQQLYEMISGTSETTSGGTVTKTEGISQEGMNEMLKSALANTAGLAAVSQGQRTAGGYGSSVNTMLTNDLMTRTASQIAQNNKTTTTSSTPQVVTKGGITGPGAAKALSFTAALQGLSELDKLTGGSKKIKDLLGGTESNGEYSNPANVSTFSGDAGTGNPNFYSTSAPAISDSTGDMGGGGDSIDFNNLGGSSGDMDFSSLEGIGIDPGSVSNSGAMTEDPLLFLQNFGFADGGEVDTQKLKSNILGSNQFNRVVDSRAGKTGGGTGSNPDMPPAAQQVAGSNSSQVTQTSSGSSDRGGESAPSSGGTLGGFVNALATPDGQTFAKAVGIMGKLTGSSDLAKAGLIGGVITSKTPALTGALTAGNIMTKGALGQGLNIAKTIKDPTIANVTNTAMSFNPLTAGVNGILSMLGFRTIGDTAGDVANNLDLRSDARNHMSPEQQQAAKDWATQQGQQVSENSDPNAQVEVGGPISDGSGIQVNDLPPLAETGSGGRDGDSYGPGSSNYAGDRGPGGSSGDTAASEGGASAAGPGGYRTGGEVSGPGTGTSDSIPARLSDGETVVTAQTTEKVKELFGENFFHNLEMQFNQGAAINQKLKGRA
jgi:hypothetical protein